MLNEVVRGEKRVTEYHGHLLAWGPGKIVIDGRAATRGMHSPSE